MAERMKRVSIGYRPNQANCLHVECPLGIINIYTGLTDHRGRAVVSVAMLPDQYAGEYPVFLTDDGRMVRSRVKSRRPLRRTVAGMLSWFLKGR